MAFCNRTTVDFIYLTSEFLFVSAASALCCGAWAQLLTPGAYLPDSMWDLTSPTRDQTCVPCVGRQILNPWTTREVPTIVDFSAFSLPQKEALHANLPTDPHPSSLQPLATPDLHSGSVDLPILDIACKWKHLLCLIFCLISFT